MRGLSKSFGNYSVFREVACEFFSGGGGLLMFFNLRLPGIGSLVL